MSGRSGLLTRSQATIRSATSSSSIGGGLSASPSPGPVSRGSRSGSSSLTTPVVTMPWVVSPEDREGEERRGACVGVRRRRRPGPQLPEGGRRVVGQRAGAEDLGVVRGELLDDRRRVELLVEGDAQEEGAPRQRGEVDRGPGQQRDPQAAVQLGADVDAVRRPARGGVLGREHGPVEGGLARVHLRPLQRVGPGVGAAGGGRRPRPCRHRARPGATRRPRPRSGTRPRPRTPPSRAAPAPPRARPCRPRGAPGRAARAAAGPPAAAGTRSWWCPGSG